MPNKKTSLRPPAIRKGAELILKANPGLHLREDHSGLEIGAGIFLLGNRPGFRWLADYFTWLADRIDETGPTGKGRVLDNPENLEADGPFNPQLSDGMCFTVGSFPQKHRAQVLRACRINRKRRLPGNLLTLFRSTLDFLQALAEDDRYRGAPALPPTIEVLEQLIGEAEQTVTRLKAVVKRSKEKRATVNVKSGNRTGTRRAAPSRKRTSSAAASKR